MADTVEGQSDRMRLVLEAEYGVGVVSLLFGDAVFELGRVKRSDVVVGREDYLAKLGADGEVENWQEMFYGEGGCVGLVDDRDSALRLVDGYHRLAVVDSLGAGEQSEVLEMVIARHVKEPAS